MTPLRVAVLGASGIGKNHARWLAGHGCEIVAFLGYSPEKLEATARILQGEIGYAPAGYTSLPELLRETTPDAVCVSTPPQAHYEHVRACLEAGAHVLCEKPLVGDDSRAPAEIIAEAWQLVRMAGDAGRLLGTQMQYGAAVPGLLEHSGARAGGQPIIDLKMEMESKNAHAGRTHEKLWIDLAPHPLSVLQKVGTVSIDWDTVRCSVAKMETSARFRVQIAGQKEPCHVAITIACNPDRTVPRRRCTVNGRSVDYEARRNAAGVFRAFYTYHDGRVVEGPDLVDALMGNFVAACQGREPLIVTGHDGAQNVEWQLRILHHRN